MWRWMSSGGTKKRLPRATAAIVGLMERASLERPRLVQLADRIILLDKGHIARQFQVNLPRPREKNLHFAELEQQVLNAVLAT